jgi:hypothetical protein
MTYRQFGDREARAVSPTYERLAHAVADDPAVVAVLDGLPEPKRQPNLLFAAARYLGGPVDDPAAFGAWVHDHRDRLLATMRVRRTQTNEPGRCATLLPVLAGLPQPLALLEVGASAGLCLYPDAYRYRYRRHTVGPADSAHTVGPADSWHAVGPADSPVVVDCDVDGPVPLPQRVPDVVWRAGLDLNPLDVTDDDDLRWLDALIWPEHDHRRARLHAAAAIARADPPLLARGDLSTELAALAARAPAGATLVVFHSAVLSYVPPDRRAAFVDRVRALPARWVANEAPGVVTDVPDPGGAASFALALDGRVVGYSAPHGQALRWLG